MRNRLFLIKHERFEKKFKDETETYYAYKNGEETLFIIETDIHYRVAWDTTKREFAKEYPKWFIKLVAQLQLVILEENKIRILLNKKSQKDVEYFNSINKWAKSILKKAT